MIWNHLDHTLASFGPHLGIETAFFVKRNLLVSKCLLLAVSEMFCDFLTNLYMDRPQIASADSTEIYAKHP